MTEIQMFGGRAFLLGGNMAVAASGEGGLLVQVDPNESEKLVATGKAGDWRWRGREVAGWLRVDSDDVRTRAATS